MKDINHMKVKGIYIKIGQTRQNEDEPGCDWVALISDVADILTLEPSFDEESAEEPKMVDPGTISFISNVLQVPQDNNNDSETSNCVGSFQHCDMGDLGIQPKEFGEQNEVDQTPSVLPSTLLDKPLVTDVSATVDVKGKNCQSISKEVLPVSNVVSKRVARPALRTCVVINMGGVEILMIIVSRPRSCQSHCKGGGGGESASNVRATYHLYKSTRSRMGLEYAVSAYCSTWDASKPILGEVNRRWTAFCGPAGPRGQASCGKWLEGDKYKDRQELKQQRGFVDQCSNGGLDQDVNVFRNNRHRRRRIRKRAPHCEPPVR
ncbi:hypothetical protein NC652_030414 [Populus alba x Populus x berolinensis]|nr:hypothetical protein NC652_030414 [Populus alba x Populus x berolinensis]